VNGENGNAYGNEEFLEFEGGLLADMAAHEFEKLVDGVVQIAWLQSVA
jgi:hypothetical protein